MISVHEIKYILEKAQSCVDSQDFKQALKYHFQLLQIHYLLFTFD